MTDKPDDGDLAFLMPFAEDGRSDNAFGSESWTAQDGQTGLTKRQWYAGMAMQGLCVGCAGMLGENFSAYAKGHCDAIISQRAFVLADAMIAEGEKK